MVLCVAGGTAHAGLRVALAAHGLRHTHSILHDDMGGRGASRFGSSSKVGRPVFNTAKDLLGIDILPCVKGVAELAAKILDVSQVCGLSLGQ